MHTQEQISAGGVAFRQGTAGPEIAIVRVRSRWQLPKGLVEAGETPEAAALREVREEAGIETELLAPLDVIEYWYVGKKRGRQVRFHKFVHFFLTAYRTGDVRNHDHEVQEARWVDVDEALSMLAFGNEQAVVEQARETIDSEP